MKFPSAGFLDARSQNTILLEGSNGPHADRLERRILEELGRSPDEAHNATATALRLAVPPTSPANPPSRSTMPATNSNTQSSPPDVIALSDAPTKAVPVDVLVQNGKSAPEIEAGSWLNTPFGPTLAARAGHWTVLVFLATRGEQSRNAATVLDDVRAQYGPRGLEVIVLVDDSGPEAEAWVAERRLLGPVGLGSTSALTYGARKIPTAVLIDREGVVRWTGDPKEGLPARLQELERLTTPFGLDR